MLIVLLALVLVLCAFLLFFYIVYQKQVIKQLKDEVAFLKSFYQTQVPKP